MKRRQVLAAGAAFGTLPLMGLLPARADQPAGLIDVHSHVFNITDIPGWSFIWVTVGRQYERETEPTPPSGVDPGLLRIGLGLFQVATLRKAAEFAPTSIGERRGQIRDGLEKAFDLSVTRTLREFYSAPNEEALLRTYGPPPALREDYPALGDINVGAALEALRSEIAVEVPGLIEAAVENPESDQALALAHVLRDGSAASDDPSWWDIASAYTDFAWRLVNRREANLEELLRRFQPDAPCLFCPSLVDFSGWLNEDPFSPIPDQIDAMDEIQRRARVPVHMFVPFNPWRCLGGEAADAFDPKPLEWVKAAITSKGALGVKLYPPMGFLPYGNETAGLRYQSRAQNFEDFAKRIDAALLELYRLCAELGAPILAHAGDGNGAGPHYGTRAHPDKWRAVLDHDDLKTLRICLAHFGSFGKQEIDDTNKAIWEDAFGKLIDDYPGRVFVDTAYLEAVLPAYAGTAQRQTAVDGLKAFPESAASRMQQIVYGSDWHMLAHVPGNEVYPAAMREHFANANVADKTDDVFVRNALRLLGIAKDENDKRPGYDRLQAYYVAHGMPFERIEALLSL